MWQDHDLYPHGDRGLLAESPGPGGGRGGVVRVDTWTGRSGNGQRPTKKKEASQDVVCPERVCPENQVLGASPVPRDIHQTRLRGCSSRYHHQGAQQTSLGAFCMFPVRTNADAYTLPSSEALLRPPMPLPPRSTSQAAPSKPASLEVRVG